MQVKTNTRPQANSSATARRAGSKSEPQARAAALDVPPPKGLLNFDQLPDSARVPVNTVAAVYGCSVSTIWRNVREGHIPKPKKLVGTTRWQVGDLRRALGVEAAR